MMIHTTKLTRWTTPMILALLIAASCSGASDSTSSAAPATSDPAAIGEPSSPEDDLGAAADSTTSTPTISPVTTPAPPTTLAPLSSADPATTAAIIEATADQACDPLDTRACLLPYPSNYFTTTDTASDTQLRVNIIPTAMPANSAGVHIDPAEWNRNDGFSPNAPLLTYIEDLDAAASNLPSWTDIEASLAADSPVVLIDATASERVALWAEPDAKAADASDRLLTIRPAVSLPNGHRFVVALRNLKDSTGSDIDPSPVFRAYRDRLQADPLEARRDQMENIFGVLADHQIPRDDLVLAWDFTVASERNVTERMIHIRDATLELLGDFSPEFTITDVIDNPEQDGSIARQVNGTVSVPNFLTGDGGPGNRFYLPENVKPTPDWLPQQNGVLQAPFTCNIPASASVAGSDVVRLAQYGHGLLGSHDEVSAGNVRLMANEHNVLFCATKWAGMSEDDIANAITTLGDFSGFATMADRLQQGVLNHIVVGRMMMTEGFFEETVFTDVIKGRLDRRHLDFDGNSQGGILGLMLTAVSPDIGRAVLGVPGMNYSLLLPRSVDFDDYELVMKPAYPNDLDRMLVISLTQMLWDRGEGAGYVHMLDKPVLLDVALGDHQVSEISALVEARTIGASFHSPWAADGRQASDTVTYGLDPIESYPFEGSAIILWDSGASTIPLEAIAPREGDDPHGDVRADPSVRAQKAAFLFDDELIDVCAGEPCAAAQR